MTFLRIICMAWRFKQQMYTVSIITKKVFKRCHRVCCPLSSIPPVNDLDLFLNNPPLIRCWQNGTGGKQNENKFLLARGTSPCGLRASVMRSGLGFNLSPLGLGRDQYWPWSSILTGLFDF